MHIIIEYKIRNQSISVEDSSTLWHSFEPAHIQRHDRIPEIQLWPFGFWCATRFSESASDHSYLKKGFLEAPLAVSCSRACTRRDSDVFVCVCVRPFLDTFLLTTSTWPGCLHLHWQDRRRSNAVCATDREPLHSDRHKRRGCCVVHARWDLVSCLCWAKPGDNEDAVGSSLAAAASLVC